MSELQIRQVRSKEYGGWFQTRNQEHLNFTTSWGVPIEKYPDWPWEDIDSSFFTLGEFAFSYPADGYLLRLYHGDKEKLWLKH